MNALEEAKKSYREEYEVPVEVLERLTPEEVMVFNSYVRACYDEMMSKVYAKRTYSDAVGD